MTEDLSRQSPTAAAPSDPFQRLLAQTDRHRREHGCGAYPFRDGDALEALARRLGARRILELGTALGYSACRLAQADPQADVDTIEGDPLHVALARENIAALALAHRIRVHHGEFAQVLETLTPGYDLAFFDGFAPQEKVLRSVERLLKPGGAFVCANLGLGGDADAVRAWLRDEAHWRPERPLEGGETWAAIKAPPTVA